MYVFINASAKFIKLEPKKKMWRDYYVFQNTRDKLLHEMPRKKKVAVHCILYSYQYYSNCNQSTSIVTAFWYHVRCMRIPKRLEAPSCCSVPKCERSADVFTIFAILATRCPRGIHCTPIIPIPDIYCIQHTKHLLTNSSQIFSAVYNRLYHAHAIYYNQYSIEVSVQR